LIPHPGDGITPIATGFTKSEEAGDSLAANMRRACSMDFVNLPHDFAETLELVFVSLTIIVSLAIMVAFGKWWQR
jgi:hypothetical protein